MEHNIRRRTKSEASLSCRPGLKPCSCSQFLWGQKHTRLHKLLLPSRYHLTDSSNVGLPKFSIHVSAQKARLSDARVTNQQDLKRCRAVYALSGVRYVRLWGIGHAYSRTLPYDEAASKPYVSTKPKPTSTHTYTERSYTSIVVFSFHQLKSKIQLQLFYSGSSCR